MVKLHDASSTKLQISKMAQIYHSEPKIMAKNGNGSRLGLLSHGGDDIKKMNAISLVQEWWSSGGGF